METISLNQIPKEQLNTLLTGVPFFKDLHKADEKEFNLLLKSSSFYEADAGEEIIKRDELDTHFFFLLRGLLVVHPSKERQVFRMVNHIHPGHDFGALSVICNTPRIATVSVDDNGPALLFGSDFKLFGELEDFSSAGLTTKLVLHKSVVNSTRWKIIVYGMTYPNCPLNPKLDNIKPFLGKANTIEELHSLHQEILSLRDLLNEWNNAFMHPGKFHISQDGLQMLPCWQTG